MIKSTFAMTLYGLIRHFLFLFFAHPNTALSLSLTPFTTVNIAFAAAWQIDAMKPATRGSGIPKNQKPILFEASFRPISHIFFCCRS